MKLLSFFFIVAISISQVALSAKKGQFSGLPTYQFFDSNYNPATSEITDLQFDSRATLAACFETMNTQKTKFLAKGYIVVDETLCKSTSDGRHPQEKKEVTGSLTFLK